MASFFSQQRRSKAQSERYAGFSTPDGGLADLIQDSYRDMGNKCLKLAEELSAMNAGELPDEDKEKLSEVMKDSIFRAQVFEKLKAAADEEEEEDEENENDENDGPKNLKKLENKIDANAQNLRKKLEAVLEESSASDADYRNHHIWTRFTNVIDGASQNDSQMTGDDSEEEEEEMNLSDGDGDGATATQMELIPLLDPISQTELTDPVKNRICGHIYGKTAMMQLVRDKRKIRCPTVGCPNRAVITAKDLLEDKNLTRKVKKRLAAKRNTEKGPSEDLD